MTQLKLFLLGSLVALGCSQFVNTVTDIKNQANTPLRCWEPVDESDLSIGHRLSAPIYPYCQYLVGSKGNFFVGGVEPESDDYSKIDAIFNPTVGNYAVGIVCLNEAASVSGPQKPSQTNFRCICVRNACNPPVELSKFIEHNNTPIKVDE